MLARIVCGKKCPKRGQKLFANSQIDGVNIKKAPPYEQRYDKDNRYLEESLLLTFGD